jgi:hypothetical protein
MPEITRRRWRFEGRRGVGSGSGLKALLRERPPAACACVHRFGGVIESRSLAYGSG